ncbi:EXECUTER 1, chloroplastic-like protein [Drosera capensis]
MTAAPIPSPTTFPTRATTITNQPLLRSSNHSFIHHHRPHSISRRRCRSTHCSSSSSSSVGGAGSGWDAAILSIVRSAGEKFDGLFGKVKDEGKKESEGEGKVGEMEEEEWDWERWLRHFEEVEEEERMIEALKAQLARALDKEDYEDAARLNVAIAAVTAKDTVGRVMSHLNTAIDQERYKDAAILRDDAGVGLVGWWSGISDDSKDPYGYVIRINAEHGRYIARSYSARQLDKASPGSPLFEIFLTLHKKGEYKHQAVYFKRKVQSGKLSSASPWSSKDSNKLTWLRAYSSKSYRADPASEDVANVEDRDSLGVIDEPIEFTSSSRDMISGDLQNNDQDPESKVIEAAIEEDYEHQEAELDDTDMDIRNRNDEELEEGIDFDTRIISTGDASRIEYEVVIGGPMRKGVSAQSTKDLLRIPAKLIKDGRKRFCFSIENANKISSGKDQTSTRRNAKRRRRAEEVIFDLIMVASSKKKIPRKLHKDLVALIHSSLNQAHDHPLLGSTTFNRIELPAFPDPLNGLYISCHVPFTSEVIQIRRKYGQWQEEQGSEAPSNLEFYEYVEAVKLTGNTDLPAGQVVFRAKVGKRYQLSQTGLGMYSDERFVLGRYKGQGRLTTPGSGKTRWVDGELLVLEGKSAEARRIGSCSAVRSMHITLRSGCWKDLYDVVDRIPLVLPFHLSPIYSSR